MRFAKLMVKTGAPVALVGLLGASLVGCAYKGTPAHAAARKAPAGEAPQQPLPPKFEVTDRVAIKTSMGTIVVGLYGKDTPNTVQNFLGYVDRGYYNGKIFHRVIPGFMIQGGGFTKDLEKTPVNDPIKLEIIPGLKHEPGIISMARMPSDIHSATSQFFLSVSYSPQLNGSYAAFGKVEKGEEVMYAISQVPTHDAESSTGTMNDVPIQPVVIESITRL
jgi:cyclophilin family peptidyl-prolyl cis-trans isomerase